MRIDMVAKGGGGGRKDTWGAWGAQRQTPRGSSIHSVCRMDKQQGPTV